jgi:hypothetical protein
MITSFDKAIAALIMGLIYIANTFFGFNFGLTEDAVTAIVAALTPILVWLVPNKQS